MSMVNAIFAEVINISMAKFIKLIRNKCKCGGIADCLAGGRERKKKSDVYDVIFGAKCNDCGLIMKADEEKVTDYFNNKLNI